MTEREIFERIEEIIASYGGRKLDELLGPKQLTPEKLFELRGKAQACKELAGAFRSTLGYDPEQF